MKSITIHAVNTNKPSMIRYVAHLLRLWLHEIKWNVDQDRVYLTWVDEGPITTAYEYTIKRDCVSVQSNHKSPYTSVGILDGATLISQAQVDKWAKLYKQGCSYGQISNLAGLQWWQVRNRLKRRRAKDAIHK